MDKSDLLFDSTRQASDKEVRRLLLFKERAEELLNNYRDAVEGRSTISISIINEPDKPLAATGLGIDRHRIKGLLMDYRPMQAPQEDVNFSKTCDLVAEMFSQPEVSNMLDRNLSIWSDTEHLSGWKNYEFSDLVSTLFNAQLFHSDLSKQAKLREVQQAFDAESLSTLLFLGVQRRCAAIRNILYCLAPFDLNCHRIRIPLQAAKPKSS